MKPAGNDAIIKPNELKKASYVKGALSSLLGGKN
ncbi:hypothetical protein MTY_0235 [Moorella thermoacetica Y72]|uniref:Uncharacterized protein n=1 Tax=Moorella thermoacetica Y72 TaxID=1325331 RepID=A0A0S6UD67_NEOTH|nr:hypothetical protein MTY_0235 [Moorella thermoacetica Y72]